jgi:glutamyl-Q tRNA(Asp) synthetase
MSALITRFAPSPTGALHKGHAFSALFAAQVGQQFLLRCEDIDPQRCKPTYWQAIEADLRWLGLSWPLPVRRQSQQMSDYQNALDRLSARGLLYPCFCTRADIVRAGGAPQVEGTGSDHGPLYPGTCRGRTDAQAKIDAGEPYALRLDMAKACAQVTEPLRWHDRAKGWQVARPALHGDIVLARTLRGVADRAALLPASYHLCVVHDDALQGISLVTRGEDLFAVTAIHRLLQELLALPVPAYFHHPLLSDSKGKRLAKRHNAPALAELRAQGLTAQHLHDEFAQWIAHWRKAD